MTCLIASEATNIELAQYEGTFRSVIKWTLGDDMVKRPVVETQMWHNNKWMSTFEIIDEYLKSHGDNKTLNPYKRR